MIYNNPFPGEWVIYKCSNCKKTFKYTMPKVSCAVMHYGKGCCHYGETEVKDD